MPGKLFLSLSKKLKTNLCERCLIGIIFWQLCNANGPVAVIHVYIDKFDDNTLYVTDEHNEKYTFSMGFFFVRWYKLQSKLSFYSSHFYNFYSSVKRLSTSCWNHLTIHTEARQYVEDM